MVRYCSCYRDTGYSNRTSVVHHHMLGVDICAHCGGVVPPKGPYTYDPNIYPNGIEHKDKNHVDDYTSNCNQARDCSKKGDHSKAIKHYKEVLRLSGPVENCEILSAVADEYEAMGDYASAERYWDRCLAVKRYDSYEYFAGKGDFLHRRKRYAQAVETYEEALKILDNLGKRNFSLSALQCYARITHFIISSYKRLEGNNTEEKYHNKLKRGIDRYFHSKWADGDESDAHYISKVAWQIYEEDRMTDEALILIDSAIKIHPTPNDYTRKAIFIKSKLEIEVLFKRIKPRDLDLINEALKILPQDCDRGPYLKTKADILDQLDDPVNAKVCRALAYKHYDEVDEAAKQLKKLRSSGTYINITGIQYYQGFAPFSEGTVVDLIKEPDNQYDPFAIRVEINGKTVGYVANNRYTLIKEVSSATDIKDSNATRAVVLFILFNKWVIAKLF